MKIGICTGGGDCPGLNAVIRAVVKHAIGSYGMEVWGITDSFNGLMCRPLDVRRMKINEVTDLLDRGGTVLGTTNAGNPFKFRDKKSGVIDNKSQMVMDAYKELGLDALVVVGGDGTQSIAAEFANLGMNIVGIPKTIDNDQAATDVSIGFQTAVDIATEALTRLRSTAESHERIMVLELMGRDAGHIALHAGIAGGANVILIPELPFEYAPIIKKIEERKNLGRYFSIVVVAEGAFEKGGAPTYNSTTTPATFATRHLGGIGAMVAEKLNQITKVDTRITVLGHVQRGGSPDAYDRILGSAFGVYAVDLIQQKKFGDVVGIKNGKFTQTKYAEVLDRTSPVSLTGHFVRTAECTGICLGRETNYISR